MEIKILGGGCARCQQLEAVTRKVVNELGYEVQFSKVKAMNEIMAYDVMTTPALVVDEKVLCSGRIPDPDEIRDWLKETN